MMFDGPRRIALAGILGVLTSASMAPGKESAQEVMGPYKLLQNYCWTWDASVKEPIEKWLAEHPDHALKPPFCEPKPSSQERAVLAAPTAPFLHAYLFRSVDESSPQLNLALETRSGWYIVEAVVVEEPHDHSGCLGGPMDLGLTVVGPAAQARLVLYQRKDGRKSNLIQCVVGAKDRPSCKGRSLFWTEY